MHAHRAGVEQRAARTASQRAFACWKHCIQALRSPCQAQAESIPMREGPDCSAGLLSISVSEDSRVSLRKMNARSY